MKNKKEGDEKSFAVMATGGKQYLVSAGDQLLVEKIKNHEGDEITFEKVLLVSENGTLKIGEPLIKNASVSGKIIEETKGPKLVAFRYKAKSNFRKKIGHRQNLLKVEITKINS